MQCDQVKNDKKKRKISDANNADGSAHWGCSS